jgi:hypothetical protein
MGMDDAGRSLVVEDIARCTFRGDFGIVRQGIDDRDG